MASDAYRDVGLAVEKVSEVRGDQLNLCVGRAQTAPENTAALWVSAGGF